MRCVANHRLPPRHLASVALAHGWSCSLSLCFKSQKAEKTNGEALRRQARPFLSVTVPDERKRREEAERLAVRRSEEARIKISLMRSCTHGLPTATITDLLHTPLIKEKITTWCRLPQAVRLPPLNGPGSSPPAADLFSSRMSGIHANAVY
jgi:hypothetical protein